MDHRIVKVLTLSLFFGLITAFVLYHAFRIKDINPRPGENSTVSFPWLHEEMNRKDLLIMSSSKSTSSIIYEDHSDISRLMKDAPDLDTGKARRQWQRNYDRRGNENAEESHTQVSQAPLQQDNEED